ncbi:Uncharacterised protein [BD1-7 clade bacterium]|uniref:Stage II sporulation protein M n=1 Tax=BD1-7 clade bacterium TaxID=2029982 RepID=A0A5S9Q2T6_9GAMM|nr:Uncharacterised protein [BD1-7 clade bacterium]CAA0112199.1 Uncharacterised protein [BD1-7 clade bacterium]
MKEQAFVDQYGDTWEQLEAYLVLSRRARKTSPLAENVPALYRSCCHHLSMARQRHYSLQLTERLNALVRDTQHELYQIKPQSRYAFMRFLVADFPATIHKNRWFVLAGMLLFFGPLLITGLVVYLDSDLLYGLMPAEQVRQFESMYDPEAKTIGRERDSATDLHMFGYYIYNNISIAFRTFAGGMLLGLGAIFFLVYNGLVIGGVMGYMGSQGFVDTFFPFVAGHGSFELTAIGLSGAAGLKLGFAIVAPGNLTRLTALKQAGKEAAIMMYAAFLMLLMAALIEAFWSSSSVLGNPTKYAVGGILWVLVIGVFLNAMLRGRPVVEGQR